MEGEKPISVDDLLARELGWRGFGPAQALALLIGGLAYMTTSNVIFLMTFTYTDPLVSSGPPAWRCANVADAACNSLLNQQLIASGLPSTSVDLTTSVLGASSAGRASALAPGADTVATPRSFCDLQRSQYVWIDPGLSLSSEYDLLCNQAWKVNLLDTLFFVGFMAGNGIFGGVGDRHGRRATLAACAAATAAVAALSASPLVPPGPGARAAASAAATAATADQTGGAGFGIGVDGDGSGGGGGGGGSFGYWLHLLLRCASGALCAGQALGSYVLATELVGPDWRGAAGMLIQAFFILGEFLLVGLSLAFPRWRSLTLAVAASCCLVLLLLPLVPESPRWLLLHGKADQARSALLWVARVNRVSVLPSLECTPAGEVFLLHTPQPQPSSVGQLPAAAVAAKADGQAQADGARRGGGDCCCNDSDPEAGGGSSFRTSAAAAAGYDSSHAGEDETAPLVPRPGDVGSGGGGGAAAATASAATAVGLCTALAHPVTRQLLLYTCFALFALSVSYYGVTLALGSLVAGSLQLNFLLTAAAELPGYLVLAATTDRIGRRRAIIAGTALSGLSCLACAFTTGGVAQVVLAMAGKLGCSGAWAVGLTFAAELFPTSLRTVALSLASQCGDLGGLVTPVLLMMTPPGRFERLPFAVMGIMSLAAVALVAQLPETRGMPQLDTFEELLEWLRQNHQKPSAAAAVTTGAAAAPLPLPQFPPAADTAGAAADALRVILDPADPGETLGSRPGSVAPSRPSATQPSLGGRLRSLSLSSTRRARASSSGGGSSARSPPGPALVARLTAAVREYEDEGAADASPDSFQDERRPLLGPRSLSATAAGRSGFMDAFSGSVGRVTEACGERKRDRGGPDDEAGEQVAVRREGLPVRARGRGPGRAPGVEARPGPEGVPQGRVSVELVGWSAGAP